MSGPIQTLPAGLLGLLNLKSSGSNPGELGQVVAPNLPILDFYLQGLLQNEFSLLGSSPSQAINSVGTKNGFAPQALVPNGFTWYVYEYSISCSLLAAEYIRFQPSVIPNQSNGGQIAVGPDYNDVISARARAAQVSAWGPFWLPPNASLSVNVFDIVTAGNITVFQAFRAAQIRL